MSKAITLNSNFLKFSFSRRLWYKLRPKSFEKSVARLEKRGVGNLDLQECSQEQKDEIVTIITTNTPQSAFKELKREGMQIDFADFSLEELYTSKRFPLFKAALASACWDLTVEESLGEAVTNGIKSILDYDIEKSDEFESKVGKIIGKSLFRGPFYIGGIIVLDAVLFPHFISGSDYFLSSDYLDYFELLPLVLDTTAGVGSWAKRSKSRILNKLEPYRFPVPLLGYWAGRSLKRALQVISFSLFWGIMHGTVLPFKALKKYAKLRSYELFGWNLQKRAEKIIENLKKWELQKALIERWLRKGKTTKAQVFFNCLIEESYYWDPSYVLESLGSEAIAKLAPGLSFKNLAQVFLDIGEENVIKLFRSLSLDQKKALLLQNFDENGKVKLPSNLAWEISLLNSLDLKEAAELLGTMSDQEATSFFENMDAKRAAKLLQLLSVDKGFERVLHLMDESKALELLANIESEEILRARFLDSLRPDLRIKLLEYLTSEEAAKLLEGEEIIELDKGTLTFPFSVRKEVMEAIVKLKIETKVKILDKMSSQDKKIKFFCAHKAEGIKEILYKYICRDGVELMMKLNKELYGRGEKVEELAELIHFEMAGFRYDAYCRLLEYLTEEEFKTYILSTLERCPLYSEDGERAYGIDYVGQVERIISTIAADKLIPLVKDLIENKVPERLSMPSFYDVNLPERLVKIFTSLPAERLVEIIKLLDEEDIKIKFLNKLSTDQKLGVLISPSIDGAVAIGLLEKLETKEAAELLEEMIKKFREENQKIALTRITDAMASGKPELEKAARRVMHVFTSELLKVESFMSDLEAAHEKATLLELLDPINLMSLAVTNKDAATIIGVIINKEEEFESDLDCQEALNAANIYFTQKLITPEQK